MPALGGAACRIVVEGEGDDFATVVATFLAGDDTALRAAAPAIYAYYQDVVETVGPEWVTSIARPDDVWDHIRFGRQVVVARDTYGDGRIYVSVECACDWEPEHGLQIIFREGHTVTKVGPYDGHLTNASAFARDDLGDALYVRVADL